MKPDEMQRQAGLECVGEAIKSLADAAGHYPEPQFQQAVYESIADLCKRLTTPLLRIER